MSDGNWRIIWSSVNDTALLTSSKPWGFDLNKDLVLQLNSGVSHVEGLDSKFLQEAISRGNYRATSSEMDINGCEIVVIAVPTPLSSNHEPDLSYIRSACEIIGKNLKNNALIINESTSFPGTVRKFIKPTILFFFFVF